MSSSLPPITTSGRQPIVRIPKNEKRGNPTSSDRMSFIFLTPKQQETKTCRPDALHDSATFGLLRSSKIQSQYQLPIPSAGIQEPHDVNYFFTFHPLLSSCFCLLLHHCYAMSLVFFSHFSLSPSLPLRSLSAPHLQVRE